ncbi:MAG: ABC transporter permease [Dermatophilaceae bacterium]|nr:ABC transporter permease [Intrasporangiaceae bacterium]
MRAPLAIAGTELRRFLRDRSNIFFALVFPLMLVLLIGLQFGDDASSRKAIVVGAQSALRDDLVSGLEDAGVVVRLSDRDSALEQLARGRSDIGLLLDEEAIAAYGTGDVRIRAVLGPQATSPLVQQQVNAVIESLRAEQSQVAALTARGLERADADAALAEASAALEPPTLVVTNIDERTQRFATGLGQFDFGASGQLLLFTFLSSLTGAATLIQARRLGVVSRTLAAPVSSLQLIGGQVLGRFTIAFFQGGYIMAASSLIFGVDWGNLAVSLLVLMLFALVSAGAAMVVGSLLDNEGAASGVGIGLGLVLAALGGSMTPLEFFPDTMRTVANLTPHAWAYEALADIQRRGAGFTDVLPELGVLAGMAVFLVLLGAWTLRRSIARAM